MDQKPIAVVTGGAGFIGSHMVDLLLSEGYQVNVIDNLVSGREQNLEHHKGNPDLRFEKVDIRNLDANHSFFQNANYVFHFAGIGDIVPSIENPALYMDVNVQGTVKVLEAAKSSPYLKKFVYAASSSCYGLAQTPTKETAPTKPEHPYALSKYLGEMACFHWKDVFNIPFNSVRIFNAYGERSRTSGAYGAVIGVFLKQKLENMPLTVVGDGEQKRDFLYVTDVAKAFYAASQTEATGEIYNLGAGNPQSVNYLVKLLNSDVVHIPKRPGEPDCTQADITKIQSELNWQPTITFEEGIQKVLDNIEYWRNAPLWNPDSIEESTKLWFECLSEKEEVCK